MNYTTGNLTVEQKSEVTARIAPIVQAVKRRYKLTGRRITRNDFARICKAEQINVADDRPTFRFMAKFDGIHGCYIRYPDGTKVIYIRDLLFDQWDSETATTFAHELGHHFGNSHMTPKELRLKRSFDPIAQDIREYEADTFAEMFLEI